MNSILSHFDAVYDKVHLWWHSKTRNRFVGTVLVFTYLASFLIIELRRHGLLPVFMENFLPGNHFYAISITFTVLLYFEVIELVFGLTESISKAVGKQFEIFSLILLRQPFKEFSHFHEPVQWSDISRSVLNITSGSVGALLIFIALAVYYAILRHQPITADDEAQTTFIVLKKTLSLFLLAVFLFTGVYYLWDYLTGGTAGQFFVSFYTILIFCDILIVLISMRYSRSFPVVFRNSGFALATVALRLALAAPYFYDAAIGVGAAVYVLLLTLTYNRFVPAGEEKEALS
jgi:hypothetical protein